jgi:hypothetical protein
VTDWAEWSRDAVAAMKARNEAWVSRFELARAPFRWDLATAELRFERATDHVVADLCLVATVSETTGTLLWAWANDAIPDGAKTEALLERNAAPPIAVRRYRDP